MKPKLTPEERANVAEWTKAAWSARSDRGFAEQWEVRNIVLELAAIIRRLEGGK